MSNKNEGKNIQDAKVQNFSKRNFYTTRDSGAMYLLAIIVPYFVALLFMLIMQAIALNNGVMTADDSISVLYDKIWFSIPYVMLTEIVFLAIYFIFHPAKKISFSATKISVKKANIWTILLCAVIGIFCVLGFMWLIEGCFGSLFESLGVATDESSSVSLPLSNFGWLILNYLLLGILPAVCEELIFRGVIFKGLKQNFSKVSAILLSALMFSLIHANVDQLIYTFVMGIVLATIFDCTNNLLCTIIVHAFNNCTTLTISYLMENNLISLDFSAKWMVSWFGNLIAVLLAAITLLLLFLVWKFYFKKHSKLDDVPAEPDTEKGIKFGKMPISLFIGIVLAAAIVVINLL